MTKNSAQQNNTVENKEKEVLKKDAWVAAMYQKKWYIGQVQDIHVDEDDHEIFVRCMSSCGKYGDSFRWPKEVNELWVKPTDNLHVLSKPPAAPGKSGRIFKVDEKDTKMIEET